MYILPFFVSARRLKIFLFSIRDESLIHPSPFVAVGHGAFQDAVLSDCISNFTAKFDFNRIPVRKNCFDVLYLACSMLYTDYTSSLALFSRDTEISSLLLETPAGVYKSALHCTDHHQVQNTMYPAIRQKELSNHRYNDHYCSFRFHS